MPWKYSQSTGHLTYENPHSGPKTQKEHAVGTGYSGAPGAVNEPARESERDVGPIPRGRWRIGHAEQHHTHLGPIVMSLTPFGHNAHDRTSFYIHGDNALGNQSASNGCIILPREIRERIGRSHDKMLEVVR